MASPTRQQVYATLLLTDSYLPGALVLAHSLRDAGTTRDLAVYYTADTVSRDSITQLKAVFNHVLPVPRLRNDDRSKLHLMNRPDLESVFTKINLWTQTQFSKIVYIDADVVAYRAPDELFDLPHAFAAAPDIGWPDIFNTGVMVLTPDLGSYYALLAMAERGISFDGADQGLLNMYFKNSFHRLSFTYNVTPSGHYQYVPAYRHFQSSINMAHFIGPNKPWFAGRHAGRGNSPYDEMIGRWWAVYDRHYRAQESVPQPQQPEPQLEHPVPQHAASQPPEIEAQPTSQSLASIPESEEASKSSVTPIQHSQELQQTAAAKEEAQPSLEMSWDAQTQPPPTDSKPEAMNFPSTHYEMSQDATPFVAPARYPSPPKNMWYEVPKSRPAAARTVFPWEKHQRAPSRDFPSVKLDTEPEDIEPPSDHIGEVFVNPPKAAETPATPAIAITPSDPWSSFSRSNAWDEVPEINKYVQGIQDLQRRGSTTEEATSVPGQTSSPTARKDKGKGPGLRLTDFPTVTERPSLPVTPAPIRRPSFWGEEGDSADGKEDSTTMAGQQLPAAPGVPVQSQWDPSEQLERLAQQHSEQLLRRLSGSTPDDGDATSPAVLSPKPVKAEAASGLVRKIVEASEDDTTEN